MIYPTITGLDIGHHSIKAVSVRLKKGQLELVACFELLLPESAFIDANTLHIEEIKPYLSQLKKKLKLNQKRIAFSIPDSSIISKVIQIDSQLDEKETEFAIAHTFEQQSSFSQEELSIDYVEIKQRDVLSTQMVTYQIFATRKDVVQSRQNSLKSAGFSPVLADAHSHALLALWQQAVLVYPTNSNWMLVDIGHFQTTFCIAPPTGNFFSKSVAFGASLSVNETEKMEDVPINLSTETKFFAQLFAHIQRQSTLYSSTHHHKVEGIWLTGGGSMIPGLSDLLSYELSLPVIELVLPSLINVSHKKIMQPNKQANQYASALGLALRGVKWLTR